MERLRFETWKANFQTHLSTSWSWSTLAISLTCKVTIMTNQSDHQGSDRLMSQNCSSKTGIWIPFPPRYQYCLSWLLKSRKLHKSLQARRFSTTCQDSWSAQSTSWEADLYSETWSLKKQESWFWSDNVPSSWQKKSCCSWAASKATENNSEWSSTMLMRTSIKSWAKNRKSQTIKSPSKDISSFWEFMVKKWWMKPRTSLETL